MSEFTLIEPGSDRLAAAIDDLAEARRQVEAASLDGAVQQDARRNVLAFCDQHPNSLHRSSSTGHLTGSAVVVDPTTERTLLIHHAKLDRWLQPGGHADGDGNLGGVALREATEETGLVGLRLVSPAVDIDIHTIPARPSEPEHVHLDVRSVVLVGDSVAARPNEETLGAKWFAVDDPEVAASVELTNLVRRGLWVAAMVVNGRSNP
ncbi:MAG: NUDIX hydrolase [Acidimicrobiales bacterium]